MAGKAVKGRKAKSAPISAEALLLRLDEVVRELEGGDLPLEQALANFEEGVQLVREGEQLLSSVEQRIEQLLADGSVAPFASAEGAGEGTDDEYDESDEPDPE